MPAIRIIAHDSFTGESAYLDTTAEVTPEGIARALCTSQVTVKPVHWLDHPNAATFIMMATADLSDSSPIAGMVYTRFDPKYVPAGYMPWANFAGV